MTSLLSVSSIHKSYGPIRALNGISLDVPAGSVFGILGPNGSGKTTMLGIVLDVLLADGGSYQWFGSMQHDSARRRIGSLLETPNFYHYLSAFDNLAISAAIKKRGHDDRLRVLDQVGLLQRKDSKFQTFSLGMKQRLGIASALLGHPEVLVLDEPANGLDPAGIAEIRDLIKSLSAAGITIIMASHLLDEVEKVCTHVAILKKGDLLLTGSAHEVLMSDDHIEVGAADLNALYGFLVQLQGVKKISRSPSTLLLHCDKQVQPADINAHCNAAGITLSHLLLKKKSLETKFMELTNEAG